MKTYTLTGEMESLLEQGPGGGRYVELKKDVYDIIGDDFETPETSGLSVTPKDGGVYEMQCGSFSILKVKLDTAKHELSVIEGTEKKKEQN